jgi:ATP-dependent DNA ligase
MPFIPPMLASRLEDPRKLADPRFITEPKLDGQRVQVHCTVVCDSPVF